jgi:hypothetical protein
MYLLKGGIKMIKSKHKGLITVALFVCFILIAPSFARAGIKKLEDLSGLDQFDRLSGLKDKFSQINPAFERLANAGQGMAGELKPAFMKMATIGENIGGGLKPSFERMANIGQGLSGEMKPSFIKMATISENMAGGLKPSFERLANINTNLAALKPGFERLANINVNLANLKPSFERLASFNANLSELKPGFTRLASVNLGSEFRPAFERLTNVNMQLAIKPAFERLANINLDTSFSPAFERLANASGLANLSSRIDNLINRNPVNLVQVVPSQNVAIPANFKAVNLASRKNIALQFAAPEALYTPLVRPLDLANLGEVAQLLQQDIHLINPEAATLRPQASYETAPQNVSMRSILATEVVK